MRKCKTGFHQFKSGSQVSLRKSASTNPKLSSASTIKLRIVLCCDWHEIHRGRSLLLGSSASILIAPIYSLSTCSQTSIAMWLESSMELHSSYTPQPLIAALRRLIDLRSLKLELLGVLSLFMLGMLIYRDLQLASEEKLQQQMQSPPPHYSRY